MAETFLVAYEPQTVQEVLEAKENRISSKWIETINEKLESMEENKTWILVSRSNNVNIILYRWILFYIFKRKYKTDKTICKYKTTSLL